MSKLFIRCNRINFIHAIGNFVYPTPSPDFEIELDGIENEEQIYKEAECWGHGDKKVSELQSKISQLESALKVAEEALNSAISGHGAISRYLNAHYQPEYDARKISKQVTNEMHEALAKIKEIRGEETKERK
jgi:hypothetical protein